MLTQTSGGIDTFTDNNSTVVEDDNASVSFFFANLRLGTEYEFTIVAFTKVGRGAEAMISVSTLPDGNYLFVLSLLMLMSWIIWYSSVRR